MTPTAEFIRKLEKLSPSDRAQLRRSAGLPLHSHLAVFDLFTSQWWPLRQKSLSAPRREVSWLVMKLHAAVPLRQPNGLDARLPFLLGRAEPRDSRLGPRFRSRFDALLQSPIHQLEPHLRWALCIVRCRSDFLDWISLTDDLSSWERKSRDTQPGTRTAWADCYLNGADPSPNFETGE